MAESGSNKVYNSFNTEMSSLWSNGAEGSESKDAMLEGL